jgi:signal transduction histidine kinase
MIVASADGLSAAGATARHSCAGCQAADDLAAQLREIARFGVALWAALLPSEPQAEPILAGDPPDDIVRLLADPAADSSALGDAGPFERFPLVVRGAALGTLLVGFAHAELPDERQLGLLALLADGLAQRLHGQRLQRRIERLTSQLAMINRLGQYTSWSHDRQLLLQQITDLVYQTLGHDHIQLLLVDDARGTVDLVQASGPAGEQLRREGFSEQVGGKGIIGWVAGSGQIWISNDTASDPRFQPHWILADTGAEIALPLKVGERIIGVLDIQSEHPRVFDADDVFLLQIVADQIASALEQGRLFMAEHRERELATTLSDVSRIICSSLDLDQVLDLILQQIDRVVPHIGTRITLLAEGTRMRVVAAKGYSDNEEAKRATFEIAQAPLAPLIMYERETVVVRDAHTDPRWIWLPGASQVRSWCGAPLVIKDRAIGFLCVDWGEPDFYSDAHARIVRAFADQAAVAIENAQLYATIKSFNEQLEHKVQLRTIELRQAHDEIAAKAEQLSALVRRVVNVQESERQRIAYDLHDSVTQAILAAIYELHALHRRVDGPIPEAARQIDECRQLLDSTLLEMREIIYALRPRALDELGLLVALEHFAGAAHAHHGLDVAFQSSGAPYPLEVAAELAIYRIVQEATQNSIRHAGAREVTIGVEFRPRQLRVTVVDDGCGFNPAQVGDGLGLVGMRERAQALGGQLTIASRAGYGTRVSLDLQRSAVERSAEP